MVESATAAEPAGVGTEAPRTAQAIEARSARSGKAVIPARDAWRARGWRAWVGREWGTGADVESEWVTPAGRCGGGAQATISADRDIGKIRRGDYARYVPLVDALGNGFRATALQSRRPMRIAWRYRPQRTSKHRRPTGSERSTRARPSTRLPSRTPAKRSPSTRRRRTR